MSMNKKLPTPKEHQLVIEVYQHINLHQRFPDNETLSEILHVEAPRISYMKGELREKGYLEGKHGHERLTTKAVNYLTNSKDIVGYKIVLSTFVPLAGEVSAGRGNRYDDLAVFLDEQGDPTDEVSIPNLGNSSDKKIVALRVRGVSMESAGILDGDYVIVELKNKDEFLGVSERQIIVTEYLSKEDENLLEEDMIDLSDISLVGYTLKVYHGVSIDKNGNKVYKLGRLRDYGQNNPHEIQTRVIRPIGSVIGVYRDTRTK
jgi:SOS-response transcriptional repressor LexA